MSDPEAPQGPERDQAIQVTTNQGAEEVSWSRYLHQVNYKDDTFFLGWYRNKLDKKSEDESGTAGSNHSKQKTTKEKPNEKEDQKSDNNSDEESDEERLQELLKDTNAFKVFYNIMRVCGVLFFFFNYTYVIISKKKRERTFLRILDSDTFDLKRQLIRRIVFIDSKIKHVVNVDTTQETFRVKFHFYLTWLATNEEYNDYQEHKKKVERKK
ncbi:hypothetical protein RFI_12549, partial [Reticulomyxa filosa]